VCCHDIVGMGRRLSTARRSAFIAAWRAELEEAALHQLRGNVRRHRFYDLLGHGDGAVPPHLARRLNAGLEGYLAALATDEAGTGDPPTHTAVDAWIDAYLLRKGDALLTSTTTREARLARLRDHERRYRASAGDRQFVQIELTTERLRALRAMRTKFGTKSLTQTIAALIDGAVSGSLATKPRAVASARRPAEPDDLFTSIESGDRPRRGRS